MKYKLLGLDIDGTIRNRNNMISDRVKNAIIHIQKQEVKAVLLSGRPVYGMLETAKEIGLEQYGGYIMAHNGAVIYDCAAKIRINQFFLPPGQLWDCCRFAREHECNMLTYDDGYMITNDIEDEIIAHEAFVNGMKLKKTEDFGEYDTGTVSKCMLVGYPDRIAKMEQIGQSLFGSQVDCFRSEPFYLEFVPKGINKGTSLAALAQSLGIEREEVAAIGDGYNDLSMIQYAGLGAAMGNAPEEVKKAADYVTACCEEDGAALVIEEFMLHDVPGDVLGIGRLSLGDGTKGQRGRGSDGEGFYKADGVLEKCVSKEGGIG